MVAREGTAASRKLSAPRGLRHLLRGICSGRFNEITPRPSTREILPALRLGPGPALAPPQSARLCCLCARRGDTPLPRLQSPSRLLWHLRRPFERAARPRDTLEGHLRDGLGISRMPAVRLVGHSPICEFVRLAIAKIHFCCCVSASPSPIIPPFARIICLNRHPGSTPWPPGTSKLARSHHKEMRAIAAASLIAIAPHGAFAQSAPEAPRFEVASVRPVAAPARFAVNITGGPGSSDPERIAFSGVPMIRLLMSAYGLPAGWLHQSEGSAPLPSRFRDLHGSRANGTTSARRCNRELRRTKSTACFRTYWPSDSG